MKMNEVTEAQSATNIHTAARDLTDLLQTDYNQVLEFRPSTGRVWTRGDGTRSREPNKLRADDRDSIEAAWRTITSLPGAKPTKSIKGEFGSSTYDPGIIYRGLLLIFRQGYIQYASPSQIKNSSTWLTKP